MIRIKEERNKVSIKYSPNLNWAFYFLLLLLIGSFYQMYHKPNLSLLQLICTLVLTAVYVAALLYKSNDIAILLELDFENQIIRYKTEKVKTIQQLEIKEGVKILTTAKSAVCVNDYPSFSFILQTPDKIVPLYDSLSYGTAFKLVQLFYRLNQQGFLSLDERGKCMVQNPSRYSLISVGVLSSFLWMSFLGAIKDVRPFWTVMESIRPSISQGTAGLMVLLVFLAPPLPVIFCYYIVSRWRGRYLTANEVAIKMSSISKEKGNFVRNTLVIAIEQKTMRWSYNDQNELLNYLVELPDNRPILVKAKLLKYPIDKDKIKNLFAEKAELAFTFEQMEYLIDSTDKRVIKLSEDI